MKVNIKLIIRVAMLGSAMFFMAPVCAQQEPMYSQYMFNMLQINPAYAGNRPNNNLTVLYRNQWTGIEGAPRTGNISWDRRSYDSNIGYGIQIYSDQLGIEKTVGFQAFYSYRINFQTSTLTMGVSGGALNYKANYVDLETSSPNDPVFSENINGIRPTVGIGLLYSREYWYMGLSVPALLQTKIKSDNVTVTSGASNHYFLSGGYLFEVNPDFKIKPSILVKGVKGSPLAFDFNTNFWFQDMLGLGVSYRPGNAVVGMFELQLTRQFRLGYAYDFTISRLTRYSEGTHEIMFRYEFGFPKKYSIFSPRYY